MLKEGWLEALQPVDIVRSFAISGLLVVGVFGSSRSWLNTRVVVGLSMLAVVCFPQTFLEFQVSGPVTPLMRMFLQLGTLSTFMLAAFLVFLKDTRDDRFWLSMFISGAVGHGLASLVLIQGQQALYNSKPGLTTQHLFFAVLFYVVMTICDLRHSLIFRGTGRSGASVGNQRLNIHLLITLAGVVLSAANNLAYPENVVKQYMEEGAALDPINVLQMRFLGVMGISGAIFFILALGFTDSTKRSLLLFTIVSSVMQLGLLLSHYLAGNLPRSVLPGMTIFFGAFIGNSLVGYFYNRK